MAKLGEEFVFTYEEPLDSAPGRIARSQATSKRAELQEEGHATTMRFDPGQIALVVLAGRPSGWYEVNTAADESDRDRKHFGLTPRPN